MSLISSSSLVVLPAASSSSSPSCLLPLSRKPGFQSRRRLSYRCQARAGDDDDTHHQLVDRRDVLLGLTGLAAASCGGGLALAADAGGCAKDAPTAQVLKCTPQADKPFYCPAQYDPNEILEFVSDFVPDRNAPPLRVRRPAHLLTKKEVATYERGLQKMMELPDSDPRSFRHQRAIHEAYCDGHYNVVSADGSTKFDVHFSSIFAPWHRMYIYFYEKIIGELAGDDTFALPYWNWDAPDGMGMPPMFMGDMSPLNHCRRNPEEKLQAFMDLNLGPAKQGDLAGVGDKCTTETYGIDCRQVKNNNLYSMYRQMNVDSPTCFHGSGFCAAGRKSSGSLENGGHTAAHLWVGGDMAKLSTAGRDPIFYSNHSNVDRLWHLWTTQLGHTDPMDDQRWLNTSFVFYDHKKRPMRINVKDVLDVKNLGYTYERKKRVEWLDMRPKPSRGINAGAGGTPLVPRPRGSPASPTFPITLVEGTTSEPVTVERRGKQQGGLKPEEVLVVDMTVDPTDYAYFQVLVNVKKGEEDKVDPSNSNYVGQFVQVPHGDAMEMKLNKISNRFNLRELIQDYSSSGDKYITVTLRRPGKPTPGDTGKPIQIDDMRVEAMC